MRVLAKNCFHCGQLLQNQAVEIVDETILSITPAEGINVFDCSVYLLTSAFVDLQVNGGGGVLLNTCPTPEGILTILHAHQTLGTGAILPTLITDTEKCMVRAVDSILDIWGEVGLLGLHLEGPHINVMKKGAHNSKLIRPFDSHTRAQIERLRTAEIPVMLTLAPELMEKDDIRTLIDMQVVVSAGHSAATYEEALEAFELGVRCSTHLYNAMPAPTARAPGLAMASILEGWHFGLIADGIHVDYPMIELAYRAHPTPENIFLVSDSMSTVGGPTAREPTGERLTERDSACFSLYGQDIWLENGRLINSEGALAGAHLDMLSAVRNLVRHTHIPLKAILQMSTTNPCKVMNLQDRSNLRGKKLGEWLALDADLEMISLAQSK